MTFSELELLRFVTHVNETGAGQLALHYLRNKEKQEVDFVLCSRNQPVLLIEAKSTQDAPAKELLSFQKLFNVPAVQLVNKENVRKIMGPHPKKVLVVTAHQWLCNLP